MPKDSQPTQRSCRPSSAAPREDDVDPAASVRAGNMKLYAKLAAAGLPLFEEPPEAQASAVTG